MITVYSLSKELGLTFTRQELMKLGVIIKKEYQIIRKENPQDYPKIHKVKQVEPEGTFYVFGYPDNYKPAMMMRLLNQNHPRIPTKEEKEEFLKKADMKYLFDNPLTPSDCVPETKAKRKRISGSAKRVIPILSEKYIVERMTELQKK